MRQLCETAQETPAQPITRSRLSLLIAASLVAPSLLAVEALAGMPVDALAISTASAVLFVLVMVRMRGLIRELEEQTTRATRLARIDGLTGIPNRRSWDIELAVALDTARADRVPLSIAMLDLDHFKRFNDEYGHQSGDRLLKSAATSWRRTLRSGAILCRYGGEEFSVILPATTIQEAESIIERLRAATPLAQTFSAGVANWNGSESSGQLVERADKALYAAKRAGRDRTHTSSTTTLDQTRATAA
jgi:diguanylate cyclase (GGDEF)-like protein